MHGHSYTLYMKKNDIKESEPYNAFTNFVYLSSFSKPFRPLTSNAGKGDSQVAVAELHHKRFWLKPLD